MVDIFFLLEMLEIFVNACIAAPMETADSQEKVASWLVFGDRVQTFVADGFVAVSQSWFVQRAVRESDLGESLARFRAKRHESNRIRNKILFLPFVLGF